MNPFLAGIFGLALGYIGARLQSLTEVRRRRISIATAMLAELEELELILRQVEQFRHSSPLLEVFPRMDVIERTADYVGVLSPQAVRALLTLNIVLRAERTNIEELDRAFAAPGTAWTEVKKLKALDEQARVIQSKAVALLGRTADVRRLLKRDGALHVDIPRLSTPELLQLP